MKLVDQPRRVPVLKRFYDALCAYEARIAGTFLVLMVALIFLGAVMRVLGNPINWSTDAATCLFAWACFLCADIAWRRNGLMAVEIVTSKLPRAGQSLCRYFNYALITAFLVYLIVMGTWLSWISRVRSFQGIPEVSYSWVTMSLPVGALVLLITTALKLRDEWRGRGELHAPGASTDVI